MNESLYESEYKKAMNSTEWTLVRNRVLHRDGDKCRFCGCKKPLQVHHIRYYNAQGETDYFDMSNLITLCMPCHEIVSEAVKKAKTTRVEVPTFEVKPGFELEQITNAIKGAAYQAERELIAETLFNLWKRSLKADCDGINMRNLNVMRPISEVVQQSIESQAGWTSMAGCVAYAQRTITRITEHLAITYDHDSREGMTDREFMYTYRLTWSQLAKVKENAKRYHETGVFHRVWQGGADG